MQNTSGSLAEKMVSDTLGDMLNDLDVPLILESLKYTKLAFESAEHPSYKMKRQQIERAEKAIEQMRAISEALAKS